MYNTQSTKNSLQHAKDKTEEKAALPIPCHCNDKKYLVNLWSEDPGKE